MPQQQVCDLVKDQRFEGFLLVRSSDQRTGGNGAKYLDMNLADRTGEVNAKVWDGNVPPPAPGSVVKVRGGTLEYNGRLQLRVERIRAMAPGDDVDIAALTPCAPEPPEDMLKELYNAIDGFQSQPIAAITREMLRRFEEKLRYYPAAQRIHHAERGGLLHHTTGMLRTARALLAVYPWLNSDLLYAGVILHDLCKTEEMDSDAMGVVRDYSCEGLHHGEAEFGSPRKPMFPEAEMLHWIDLLDARMNEMQTAVAKLKPRVFSEKIWSLDRRLYHADYDALKENAPEG